MTHRSTDQTVNADPAASPAETTRTSPSRLPCAMLRRPPPHPANAVHRCPERRSRDLAAPAPAIGGGRDLRRRSPPEPAVL